MACVPVQISRGFSEEGDEDDLQAVPCRIDRSLGSSPSRKSLTEPVVSQFSLC